MSKRARKPRQAIERYYDALQKSLSTVSDAIWRIAEYRGDQLNLFPSRAPLPLATSDGRRLYLAAGQRFHTYWDGLEYRVRTDGYLYTLSDSEALETEIIGWHWHPETAMRPHIHTAGLVGHVPTGRVSFEAIVRYLIEECGVVPARDDWAAVLDEVEKRHVVYRSWHAHPESG